MVSKVPMLSELAPNVSVNITNSLSQHFIFPAICEHNSMQSTAVRVFNCSTAKLPTYLNYKQLKFLALINL